MLKANGKCSTALHTFALLVVAAELLEGDDTRFAGVMTAPTSTELTKAYDALHEDVKNDAAIKEAYGAILKKLSPSAPVVSGAAAAAAVVEGAVVVARSAAEKAAAALRKQEAAIAEVFTAEKSFINSVEKIIGYIESIPKEERKPFHKELLNHLNVILAFSKGLQAVNSPNLEGVDEKDVMAAKALAVVQAMAGVFNDSKVVEAYQFVCALYASSRVFVERNLGENKEFSKEIKDGVNVRTISVPEVIISLVPVSSDLLITLFQKITKYKSQAEAIAKEMGYKPKDNTPKDFQGALDNVGNLVINKGQDVAAALMNLKLAFIMLGPDFVSSGKVQDEPLLNKKNKNELYKIVYSQVQVLSAQGKTGQEIANVLGISTVEYNNRIEFIDKEVKALLPAVLKAEFKKLPAHFSSKKLGRRALNIAKKRIDDAGHKEIEGNVKDAEDAGRAQNYKNILKMLSDLPDDMMSQENLDQLLGVKLGEGLRNIRYVLKKIAKGNPNKSDMQKVEAIAKRLNIKLIDVLGKQQIIEVLDGRGNLSAEGDRTVLENLKLMDDERVKVMKPLVSKWIQDHTESEKTESQKIFLLHYGERLKLLFPHDSVVKLIDLIGKGSNDKAVKDAYAAFQVAGQATAKKKKKQV